MSLCLTAECEHLRSGQFITTSERVVAIFPSRPGPCDTSADLLIGYLDPWGMSGSILTSKVETIT